MGSVTVFNITRMQEIENNTIVGASIVDGELILEKHDETTINVGAINAEAVINYVGDWSDVATYAVNEIVNHVGSTWICMTAVTAGNEGLEPGVDANWESFISVEDLDGEQLLLDILAALDEVTNFDGDEHLVIIQDGVMKITPLADVIAVDMPNHASDSFVRADNASSLGTADGVPAGGAALTYAQTGGSGTFGIVGNTPIRSVGGFRIATVNTGDDTHGVRVTITSAANTNTNGLRLYCRFASASQHYLLYATGSGYRIARVNPSAVNIGTHYTTAVSPGHTLELRANGTTIELLHNDVVVVSVDESAAIASVPALGTNTSAGWAQGTTAATISDIIFTNEAAITFNMLVDEVQGFQALVDGLSDEVDDLAALVGAPAIRNDWVDPLTGLIYKGHIYVDPISGDGDAIQDAIDLAAAVPGLDENNRMMVLIPPGTYATTVASANQRILLANGVDVRGATGDPADVLITNDIHNDNFEAGGRHTLLGFLTARHLTDYTDYALHVDTLPDVGVTTPELVLISLVLSSHHKQACGIGTRYDQRIFAYDCDFQMVNTAYNQSALFLHNDAGGTAAAIAVFENCVALSSGNGSSSGGLAVTQYNSGQADQFWWIGGNMDGHSSASDLVITADGGGTQSWIEFFVTASAYGSSNITGAGDFQAPTGVAPTPTRMPMRQFA